MIESHWVKKAEAALARSEEASYGAESAALHLAQAQVYATLSVTARLELVAVKLAGIATRIDCLGPAE